MGINIVFTSEDSKFKPFNLYFEPYIPDDTNVSRSTFKLVNKDLGLEIYLANSDNETIINQKIQNDLDLSFKKIVKEFDDDKLIFQSLKKIRANLESLANPNFDS